VQARSRIRPLHFCPPEGGFPGPPAGHITGEVGARLHPHEGRLVSCNERRFFHRARSLELPEMAYGSKIPLARRSVRKPTPL